MDGRVGVMILGCASLATGYFAYDSHNHRVVAEKKEATAKVQELTKQIQQQEESRRAAVLVSALKAKDALFYDTMTGNTDLAARALTERLAERGHGASSIAVGGKTDDREAIAALNARAESEPAEPLMVSGVFDVVELNKKTGKWSMQIRSSETREDLMVDLSEDALNVDLAEAQKMVNEAFYVNRKIAAVVVCSERECRLVNVKWVVEGE